MVPNDPLPQNATNTETSCEPPRLLDRMRFTLRAKHYAYRTEQAYVHWIERYIRWHAKLLDQMRQVLRTVQASRLWV